MSGEMNCALVKPAFALYLYGELSFDEEERVESHLDRCAGCRGALARERELHACFDSLGLEPAPSLLRECRDGLRAGLIEEEAAPARKHAGWWEQFVDTLTMRPSAGWLRPAGALTMVALGFFAARMIPSNAFSGRGGFQAMGLAEPAASRVRYLEPAADGRIQIVLDETRQRIVSGRLEDPQIRSLVLSAAKDPSDPGLRAETVDILNRGVHSADVRDVLVYALRHDQNSGVRLKAMEGLKQFVREPDVRGALAQILLTDANPGLRTQAIDLLTQGFNENTDRQIIGTLQELMLRESNTYVRQRCRSMLESVKASTETY